MKKNKTGRIVLGICGGLILAAVVAYVGVSVYFTERFYPNTTINGESVSAKTADEVKDMLSARTKDYELKIHTIEDTEETINGDKIAFSYDFSVVDELKENEAGWLWFTRLFTPQDYTVTSAFTYDKELLSKQIDQLTCMTQEMTAPVNASLKSDDEGVSVVTEVVGNTLKKEDVHEVIDQAVQSGQTEVDLVEEDCYELPTVTVEDPEIKSKLEEIDTLIGAEVTYNIYGNTEVVGIDQVRSFMRLDEETGKIIVSEDAVTAYVQGLADKYNTLNKTREFLAHTGKIIQVEPGDYGYDIDVESTAEHLLEDVNKKVVETIEPEYYATPYIEPNSTTGDDIGDTYIEVDLGIQHLYYYENGELYLDTDITSGTLDGTHETPGGVYYVTEVERNATLTGEDYRTVVSYWIGVIGSSIGIHDSTWRYEYGPGVNSYDGSHGCINTPYDIVEELWGRVTVGVPVIMYY